MGYVAYGLLLSLVWVRLFAVDVARDQVWFSKVGNDLVAQIIGTNDKATLTGWYAATPVRTDQFKSGDGRTLIDSNVQQLVTAMALLTAPPLGQTTLDAAQHAALDSTIAAVWQ